MSSNWTPVCKFHIYYLDCFRRMRYLLLKTSADWNWEHRSLADSNWIWFELCTKKIFRKLLFVLFLKKIKCNIIYWHQCASWKLTFRIIVFIHLAFFCLVYHMVLVISTSFLTIFTLKISFKLVQQIVAIKRIFQSPSIMRFVVAFPAQKVFNLMHTDGN